MADTQPNRIKVSQTELSAMPEPPRLAAHIAGRVLTKTEAVIYDTQFKAWWEKVQLAWKKSLESTLNVP